MKGIGVGQRYGFRAQEIGHHSGAYFLTRKIAGGSLRQAHRSAIPL